MTLDNLGSRPVKCQELTPQPRRLRHGKVNLMNGKNYVSIYDDYRKELEVWKNDQVLKDQLDALPTLLAARRLSHQLMLFTEAVKQAAKAR